VVDPTHPRMHCTDCGAENDPENGFCGTCIAPLALAVEDSVDHSLDGASGPRIRLLPLGELSVDRIRSLGAQPMREALLGGLLAVGVALVQIVGLYLLLLVRWAVGAGDAPSVGAVVGFVAAHGGAVLAKVPPMPVLLGLGGSLKIDPPITTIALLPFVLMLAGSWVLSRRERTFLVFALVAPVCYSLILAVLALVFRVTFAGGGAEITVSAAPDESLQPLQPRVQGSAGEIGIAGSRLHVPQPTAHLCHGAFQETSAPEDSAITSRTLLHHTDHGPLLPPHGGPRRRGRGRSRRIFRITGRRLL
jgi:hypothetical protein